MEPRKHNLYISCPAYTGNSGSGSLHPDVSRYISELLLKLKDDPRIDAVYVDYEADTPVTMVRNNAVLKARAAKCDLLMMIDSDQSPDKHKGESWFRPFWDEAFEEIYRHYDQGPLVIGAPYCGPPNVEENVYVFYFENNCLRGDETPFKLVAYPRTFAAQLDGVQEVAALPTGLILFDMRAFELIEPSHQSWDQVLDEFQEGKIDKRAAIRNLSRGWFYYEWKNGYGAEKASTEDVTVTRDIALAGIVKLGYNPLRCAWSSWIGHHKPWNVGKPGGFSVDQVGSVMQRAVISNRDSRERRVEVKPHPILEQLMRRQGVLEAVDGTNSA